MNILAKKRFIQYIRLLGEMGRRDLCEVHRMYDCKVG